MPGTLVLVCGPSGAGKDTLIEGAREHFAGAGWIAFPRRMVTRHAGAGGEDHVALDAEAFAARRRDGGFCLAWSAHGLGYGVPVAVAEAVRAGTVAVVNASRGVLPEAERLGVPLRVVHVTCRAETLARRLALRGREDGAAIAGRLLRRAPLRAGRATVVEIGNDGPVERGVALMVAALAALEPAAGAATGCGSAPAGRPAGTGRDR